MYMLKMNLKEPVDVWYHNMRAFLTIEMDAQKAWVRKIIELAYPPDAMWFRMHVEGTFLAFCTTEQQGDEFLQHLRAKKLCFRSLVGKSRRLIRTGNILGRINSSHTLGWARRSLPRLNFRLTLYQVEIYRDFPMSSNKHVSSYGSSTFRSTLLSSI